MAIPKKYLWLVVGFLVGSYLGFAELADLLGKVGSDVKQAVLEPVPEPALPAHQRAASRPSTYRFYRSPEH